MAQVIIALKTKFNAEKLYREIVKLDVSAHRYSLIAIKDSFMGYKSNRILTKYFEGKWNEYMFLSFPTAAERDEESLKNAIGAALKIPRDVIHLYQKASIYQPKISQDWNTVRAYYNTYYVVYIDSFPELLKNNEFEIDGVHYKWMTLEQMEREAEKKEHNKNERRTFARYIFTPARYTDLYSEPRKNVWKMSHNVCIRLNRKCDLSCKFCLACSENTLMLSTDVVKQCLCLLKNNGVRRARLGGGEPTRHPGFMEIVRYSVNLGMDTIVYSNLYDVDKQFRHKIEINIDVKNQKRLIIKELDEGNVQQNFYSKKLAQHISDLVGVNGNMKFLFIRDEADNCWIGVLLPEMAGSYLWDINMCQKKEYLPKDYKEEIIISIYRKFWNLLEKEEIEHCYFISNCLVSGISDYRLAIYYTAMYAYTLAKQMAAIQRRCKKIESRLSLNQPLVVDGTGTLLDIYVYQSYQLENIEIKEFRDGLTLMEHMVLKYLLQERDIENSIGYGYRMRKIIEHAKISLRQKAVEYYGWSYIRSMFA